MKRVYRTVAVHRTDTGLYTILLDGKAIRTPAKRDFVVSSERLAQGIKTEWAVQPNEFAPETMKLTQLVSTTLDRIQPNLPAALDGVLEFLKTDHICYRASEPQDLVTLQSTRLDPLLEWFEERTGETLAVARGVMPITQPDSLLLTMRSRLETKLPDELTVLQTAAALTASLIIPLALVEGHISASQAFETGFLDELYQVRRWGADTEAVARLDAAKAELSSLQRYLFLLS